MTSQAFVTLIDVESSLGSSKADSIPIAPQKAVAKSYHAVPLPNAPDVVELDNIEWGAKFNSPKNVSKSQPGSGYQTPQTPNDIEISRPLSPASNNRDGVDITQSFSNPPMNRFRMVSSSLLIFSNGLSDSAPGALIPYIEKYYGIGYAVVSIIFVTNAIGFIVAAFCVDGLRSRLGRAKTLIIGQILSIIGFAAIVCTPPFGVVIAAFFFLGLGIAINLALGNVFAANLHNSTKMLGIIHGSYGIGGTIGPIIATAMVTKGGLPWSRYYLITLSMAIFNLAFAAWSFWTYEVETGSNLLPLERPPSGLDGSTNVQSITKRPSEFSQIKTNLLNMIKSFKSKTVILGALFIFAYQGAEVSISGWVISFLITTRHGNPAAVGYVTAGFWGGITLGRFLLSHPAHRIGEKLFVYGMVVGSALFELLVWQVPNVVGDAVALGVMGLLLGPVYPCAMVIFSRGIGKKDQVSSLGVISAFGSSGGAVAPFTTGILAQAAGTFVLHPIAIGLFGVMLVCWYCLPNVRKRTE